MAMMVVVVVVAATVKAAVVVMAAVASRVDSSSYRIDSIFYYFEFTASASTAYRVSAAGVIGGRVLIETPRLSIVSLGPDNATIIIIYTYTEVL